MRRALGVALLLLGAAAAAPLAGQLTISARAASITFGGYFQPQYTISSVNGDNGRPDAIDDALIRRARATIDFKVGASLDGRLEYDFAPAGIGLTDIYGRVTFAPEFRVSIGQMKRAFSAFELASDTDLPDIERDGRIEGVNTCPGNIGGSCSFSRLSERLQYDDRDIGLRVEGDLGKRFQYQATLTNGQGRNVADVNDAKSPALRATFLPTADVRLSAFGGLHDYVPAPSAGVIPGTTYAHAGGADVEVGTFRKGFHLMAGAIGGDNWLAGPNANFWAAQAMGTLYLPVKDNGRLAGVEPMLRLDRSSVDDVPGGAVGQMHTVTVTPGFSFYLSGKNWLDFNLDLYRPSDGKAQSDWSFKTQLFMYF